MEDLDQLLDEADRYCGNTEDNKVRHSSKTNNNKVMLDQQVAR